MYCVYNYGFYSPYYIYHSLFSVPGKPSGVVATATSSTSINVGWMSPQHAADVEGYVIKYEPGPGTTANCADMMGGEVTVAGETESAVGGLQEGTEYTVRVAAFNTFGRGQFSEPPVEVCTEEEGIYILYMYITSMLHYSTRMSNDKHTLSSKHTVLACVLVHSTLIVVRHCRLHTHTHTHTHTQEGYFIWRSGYTHQREFV